MPLNVTLGEPPKSNVGSEEPYGAADGSPCESVHGAALSVEPLTWSRTGVPAE